MSGYLVQGGVTPDDSVSTAKIQDDAVTLAKLAAGTDGNIISYDASGNPVAIATGSDGQVLTSAGAGQPPAFEAAGGGAVYTEIARTDLEPGTPTEWAYEGLALRDYYELRLTLVGVTASSAFGGMNIIFGTGGTPTYLTSNYQRANVYFNHDGATTENRSSSTTKIYITYMSKNKLGAVIHIAQAATHDTIPTLWGVCGGFSNSGAGYEAVAGSNSTTDEVTAIKIVGGQTITGGLSILEGILI